MTSKQRMLAVLDGKSVDAIPVAPHWWGVYKHEIAETDGITAASTANGEHRVSHLTEVDAHFYQVFSPDWFHLGAAEWHLDPYAERQEDRQNLIERLQRLNDATVIEDYLAVEALTEEDIRKTGTYEHVREIVKRYGGDVFVAVNEGNPVCGVFDPHGLIGFERGLVALVEKPHLMERLLFGLYDLRLTWMRVLADFGCHAYIGSETYVGADLISPNAYRSVIFPAQEHFYKSLSVIGLIPIAYYCGDVVPMIPVINELPIKALMVEESRKGFELDPVNIRQKLAESITLFGNLDTVSTLR
ncbi:MAG TPA: uroporphyrinogen decarboxylase family protein, partial [bacterium]|nr:uroporphyrinogen decarboxylase family protein [bacterium]